MEKKGQISGIMGFYYIRYYLKHYTERIFARNDAIFKILCTFALIYKPNRGMIWKRNRKENIT